MADASPSTRDPASRKGKSRAHFNTYPLGPCSRVECLLGETSSGPIRATKLRGASRSVSVPMSVPASRRTTSPPDEVVHEQQVAPASGFAAFHPSYDKSFAEDAPSSSSQSAEGSHAPCAADKKGRSDLQFTPLKRFNMSDYLASRLTAASSLAGCSLSSDSRSEILDAPFATGCHEDSTATPLPTSHRRSGGGSGGSGSICNSSTAPTWTCPFRSSDGGSNASSGSMAESANRKHANADPICIVPRPPAAPHDPMFKLERKPQSLTRRTFRPDGREVSVELSRLRERSGHRNPRGMRSPGRRSLQWEHDADDMLASFAVPARVLARTKKWEDDLNDVLAVCRF
eukprot:CAMPEP_0203899816 /NCGR_PEP_ID=MMETSP0359-20131031/42171_1 /ASSEMBLY_ACC=CAM_ASM_000338 /TAXON_ID=268821 /ORGANISM="Scrippsiella Hangoei, Strain SHTV-5" /LENGTH=343 /DNA_ID=CAMNT_0050823141 /DNA_START=43 /DNA_END=1074 /DNA_ORIENTATION=+